MPLAGFQTPVLFLLFNRPETTARVFEKIKAVRPTRLFIAADGPRQTRPFERDVCKAVREQVINGVDWACEIKTLFRDENLGCGQAVYRAIDWFFNQVEEGIILEDDCLPSLSFFSFCETLLHRYRKHNSVKHIGGNNFQCGIFRGDGDYYYSTLTHIWGWATWRRAWNDYRFHLDEQQPIAPIDFRRAFYSNINAVEYFKKQFELVAQGEIDTWDYQWLYTNILKKGLAVCPNVNLVENIGFGKDATHTKLKTAANSIAASEQFSFRQPTQLKLCREADEFTFESLFGITQTQPSVLQRFRRRIIQLKTHLNK